MPKTYPGERNPNWKGGISKKEFICISCGANFYGHHSRNAKYCSRACKRNEQIGKTGELSNRWLGGEREKICLGCGIKIVWQPKKPYSVFKAQKFCSKDCADKNGLRYRGAEHWRFNPEKIARDMVKQARWSKLILNRDNFTCQDCGKRGGDLHAHHIIPYIEDTEKRWELENGKTLCVKCHYKTYKFYSNQFTGGTEKRVNSGEVQNG